MSSSAGAETISVFYSGSGSFKLEGEKQTFYAELNNATTADEYMTVESSDATAISLSAATCKSDDVITATCLKAFTGTVTITFAKENDATLLKTLDFTFTTSSLGSASLSSIWVSDVGGGMTECYTSDSSKYANNDGAAYESSCWVENSTKTGFDAMAKNYYSSTSSVYLAYSNTADVSAWPASVCFNITSTSGTAYTTDLTGLPEFDANGVGTVDFTRLMLSGSYIVPAASQTGWFDKTGMKGTLTKKSDFSYDLRIYFALGTFKGLNALQESTWNDTGSAVYIQTGANISDPSYYTQGGININYATRGTDYYDCWSTITILKKPITLCGTFYASYGTRWHKRESNAIGARDFWKETTA